VPPSGSSSGVDRRTLQKARRKQAKRERRRWPRRLLIGAVVVVLLAAALGAGTWFYARYRYNQIKKVHAKHLVAQAAPGKPFNILLVGSDSRSFVKTTPKKKTEFEGTGTTVGGQRSDVTMVARIIPATKQIWILSIPRDLWVNIPGNGSEAGTNRINAAFNTGPDLLIQTIEQDLKIPINHYISVTFTGFQGMVNALGGVTMDFPDPVKDAYSGLDVTQTGCQVVDGATALELVRARHLYYEVTGEWKYDGLSDFSRIQRQDAFFRAVLAKINSVKFDPLTINSFLGDAVKNLTIDDTLSEHQLISLGDEFHGLPSANLHTETLPTVGFVTSGGADVLNEAQPYADDMIDAFNQLGATVPATTTTTTKPTTVPTLAPSQVSVQVLNGVDFTKPIASDTEAELKQAGFVVTGAANAPAVGVTTTQIEYAEGHKAAGQVLAAHLSGATELVADPQLTGNEVVLTVGSSFTGITSTAGTSSSTTTTTTVPPPPSNVYTNTQPEPWNPTPCTL
jgi:LCP family protein required for cell wall assembly